MNYTLRNLLVAALLMLLGIVAVTSFIRGERKDLARGKQEVQVFVAAKDIPSGTAGSELEKGGYLESKDMLREDVPPNAVGKVETIEKLVADQNVYKGEVVSLTAFDKTAGLAPTSQIKGNERIFAVPVQATSDAAGLIRAGDHVDISAGLNTTDGQQILGAVIARDVQILETPETLTPEGVEVEEAAPEADGDTKLYVLKTTDKEWMNITFALANSDDRGLIFALRPANGGAETKIPPIFGGYQAPTGKPIETQNGPDPSVR